ncbi:hypothetical protein BD309DRAFT_1085291 [Dichomitus squalens]|nr:hypothetical protein BD309DRAFT_1085291 [Dichomitus squalens]
MYVYTIPDPGLPFAFPDSDAELEQQGRRVFGRLVGSSERPTERRRVSSIEAIHSIMELRKQAVAILIPTSKLQPKCFGAARSHYDG